MMVIEIGVYDDERNTLAHKKMHYIYKSTTHQVLFALVPGHVLRHLCPLMNFGEIPPRNFGVAWAQPDTTQGASPSPDVPRPDAAAAFSDEPCTK